MGKRNLFCKRYWLFYLQVALLDLNKQDFIVLKLVTDRCVREYSTFIFYFYLRFFTLFFFFLPPSIYFVYEMRKRQTKTLFSSFSNLQQFDKNYSRIYSFALRMARFAAFIFLTRVNWVLSKWLLLHKFMLFVCAKVQVSMVR